MSKTLRPDQIGQHCLGVLKAVAYEVHTEILRIVDLSFEFDQVLTGPHGHHALVLLVDQPELAVDVLKRRLSSLVLALSRTGSRRPVTLVLVAPPLNQRDLDALRQLARLIAIDRVSRPAVSVDHILREFLPLSTNDVSAPLVDASGELTKVLGAKEGHPHVQKLIQAASKGQEAVELAFRALLDEAIKDPSAPEP